MRVEAIAGLPLVLAVVCAQLAVGGAALLLFLDRTQGTPAGFRKLTAAVDLAIIAFAAALLPALPRGDLAQRAGLDAAAIAAFGALLPILVVVLAIHALTCFVGPRALRDLAGVAVIAVGGWAFVSVTGARPGGASLDPLALAAIPLGALALGGSNTAMLLGHWYLVTPKLSPGPLRLASIAVFIALLLQTALVGAAIVRGEFADVTQTSIWIALAWRVGVGLVLALLVTLGAWWTARMNTQSSTGLLYVALGCILAGESAARIVFFLTGAAV